VHAWTAAASRRLVEALLGGSRAFVFRSRQRLPLTRKALEPARPTEPHWAEAPCSTTGRSARHGSYDRISSRRQYHLDQKPS